MIIILLRQSFANRNRHQPFKGVTLYSISRNFRKKEYALLIIYKVALMIFDGL